MINLSAILFLMLLLGLLYFAVIRLAQEMNKK